MKTFRSSLAIAAFVGGLASLLSAAAPADAQTRGETEIREQYLADRAACLSRYSGEKQQNCLREAGAAAQAARQGNLAHDEERYRLNALARCTPLPPEQREACRMRIEGAGTVRGSVEGGGLYRELRTVEPAPQATTTVVPPTTTVVPPTTTAPPVVAPAPAAPPAPAAGTPGRPTFTPVQPVVPGRAAPAPATVAPMPATAPSMPVAPSTPVGATGAVPPSAVDAVPPSPPASLQISPPATPVLQVPTAPATGAVQPPAPEPLLVTPGSAPPESDR